MDVRFGFGLFDGVSRIPEFVECVIVQLWECKRKEQAGKVKLVMHVVNASPSCSSRRV